MCGIFAYIGNKHNAANITLEGLKLLEYRGYDSWGIAVKDNNHIATEKHVGKIGEAVVNLPDSNIGIGHTRWATHGGVTVANSHPHMDCTKQLAVIHNGIVENFSEIKQELINMGHTFTSDTDTEVIPHLIEENLKKEDFTTAVRSAFNKLSGLNAIVVLNSSSSEIIAAKTGSPLIIGEKDGQFFLASDASGIIKHTNKLLFLKDKQMVVMGKDLQIFQLPSGEKLSNYFEEVDWKFEDSQIGDYAHYMLKEINEQPKIIRNIAENYSDSALELARIVRDARGTFFIGAGTAFYAGLAGTYLFSKISKIHVNTAVASEFNYLEDFLNKESLIIALSQSGETIDVVEPLQRAKLKGSKIGAIVNTLGSTIYRMADVKMLIGAGPEKAVASTKAYTAKLSILFMTANAINNNLAKAKDSLLQASREAERLLEDSNLKIIQNLALLLKDVENLFIIGRGVSYPTSQEAALKIKEVSYIHTEGLAGGELKHGTIALISEGTYCIVFAPLDETYEAIISNATEIKARGGKLIGIGPLRNEIFDYWIEIKDTSEASMIPMIIPIQLLAYYLALNKGFDPDKPRNLAKSVTVK